MSNFNPMAKIAVNKSILKEFQVGSDKRVVYLNNNDEFQIQLFNPNSFTVGAEISINGDTIPGVIVIKPGERHWLERPMDKPKKFKFETYEVEDTAEVSKAISHNGEVIVRFYKEKVTPSYSLNYSYISSPIYYKGASRGISTSEPYSTCCNSVSSIDGNYLSNCYSDSKSISDTRSFSSKLCSNAINDTIVLGAADNKIETNALLSLDYEATPTAEVATMETGRISSGSHSNQKFNEVNIEFETWTYDSEVIKILPMSRKPYTNSDLQKIYCTNCGRKLNSKYKFCPYCGSKCEQFD